MHNLLEALVWAIGWALLNFVWQGVLIGCSVALAMQLLRRARPQIRYAVACGAMLLCLILPLASVISSLHAGAAQRAAPADWIARIKSSTPTTFNPAPEAGTAAQLDSAASAAAVTVGWRALRALQAASEQQVRGQLPWIVGLWLGGAVLMSLRLMLGLQWVAAHTRRTAYTINHYWQRRMAMLASRCDMRRDVRLGVAVGIDSPITAGCWRPIILVPASLISGMPPDLLEALLAHELAHIRRHDYLVNLLQSAIEILLFYHPSVWALSRRIRLEREQIADDLAVDMLGQPHKLAQALAQLDQFQFDSTQLAHAAHGGNLMSRIQRLVRPTSHPASAKLALPLLGLIAAGCLLYAHASPLVGQDAAAANPAVSAAPAAPAVPATSSASVVPTLPPLPALPAPPAPPAPALPAAPPAPPAPPALGPIDARGSAYALVHDRELSMTTRVSGRDSAEIDAARARIQSDFIWFREGKQSYVIQDAATVAQAQAAWAEVKSLGQRMEQQGKLMDQQGKVMDDIGKQIDAAGRELERHAAHQSAAQQASERALQALQERMAQASQPMAQLGQRMGELAREQELASRAAAHAMRDLIRAAQKDGKAKRIGAPDPA